MSHPGLAVFDREVLFANSTVDGEYLDQQLSTITGYWVDGNLEAIVQQGQVIIDQEIYDLRFTAYYFYSLWVSEPDCALVEVLQALLNLLQQQSSVWLPDGVVLAEGDVADGEDDTSTDARHLIQTCLGMLFKRIAQRLGRFGDDVGEVEPCRIIELCDGLKDCLIERCRVPEVTGSLTEIGRFFEVACEAETPSPQPLSLIGRGAKDGDSLESDDLGESGVLVENSHPNPSPRGRGALPDSVVDASGTDSPPLPMEAPFLSKRSGERRPGGEGVSIPLQQLLEKLEVFEALMQQEELYKAAVVFELIQEELQAFNPVRYLPELFAGYAGVRALYAEPLAELLGQRESVQWQALREYFLADPVGYQRLDFEWSGVGEGREEMEVPVGEEEDFELAAFQRQMQSERGGLFDDD